MRNAATKKAHAPLGTQEELQRHPSGKSSRQHGHAQPVGWVIDPAPPATSRELGQ